MASDEWVAVNLFVGITLAAFATVLLAFGRRRAEGLTLSVFLLLVGTNYLGIALGEATGATAWFVLANVALALDPFYLLAFVTLYPYRRRPPVVRALLGLVGGAAVVSLALVVLATDVTVLGLGAAHRSPGHVFLIGTMALAYFGAWLLAARTAVEAPTPLLARRAAWLVVAVGAATLPRLGQLRSDLTLPFQLPPMSFLEPWLAPKAVDALRWLPLELVPAAIALAVAGAAALARPGPHSAAASRALRTVAALVVALALLHAGLEVWSYHGGPRIGSTVAYAMRWLVFAAILVHGALAYEVVPLRLASTTLLPPLLATTAGLAAFFLAHTLLVSRTAAPEVALALALAVALAAILPGAALARKLVQGLARRGGTDEASERGLDLYRAALETAWAAGPPSEDARRRLERDRRTLGLTREEARALEYVVRRPAPPSPDLVAGSEPLPGVVVEGLIGEGAQGRVLAARRYPAGERVVVKEHRSLATPEERARFLTETRALQALDHPNIVRLLDARVTQGRGYLLLAHVDGEPLSRRIAAGPLPRDLTRALLVDVLDALEAAHAAGTLHLDVKPENVLVTPEGRACLTDFGVARAIDAPAPRLTVAGYDALRTVAGTLAFMAPEQAKGEPVGPATDLYATGLLAYEALTGRPALDLAGAGVYAALDRVLRPRVDLAPVPAPWRAWLSRALEPEIARRYASAGEMRAALREVQA